MLPLWFQGLALPNPNTDVLSKKIHLLQSHWDTGSTSGRMLHQTYQVVEISFHNLLSPLVDFLPLGSLEISRNSCIDTRT